MVNSNPVRKLENTKKHFTKDVQMGIKHMKKCSQLGKLEYKPQGYFYQNG